MVPLSVQSGSSGFRAVQSGSAQCSERFRAVPQGSYLGFCGEHVVPQDGGPATGQLADVGDDHHGQGQRLEHTA